MKDNRRAAAFLAPWLALRFPTWSRLLLLVGIGLAGMGAIYPPPSDKAESTNGLPSELGLAQHPLREISPGVYGIGLVHLDRNKQTVSFPGAINMVEGHVEYALVHSRGKVHESVLRTEVEPFQIHLAKLLISQTEKSALVPDQKAPRELRGSEVVIWVTWKDGGTEKRVRIEELVFNLLTKSRMSRGYWVYGGSRVIDGVFLAQRDGSIFSIIADPDALVNNPRPGRNDDEIWTVHTALAPPVGTAVEITIELERNREE
jgi:hypothetical protein